MTSHEASICIPVFPNDQDVPALAARASAYLLAGHGLYTWGSSLAEAARHAVALEHLLACELDHEDEARRFAEGRGAFYLHTGGKVLVVVCERSDYLRVPAGTRHWFDMGPDPEFTAVRLFTDPAGWVASFTGETIADRFPRFE